MSLVAFFVCVAAAVGSMVVQAIILDPDDVPDAGKSCWSGIGAVVFLASGAMFLLGLLAIVVFVCVNL